MPTRKRVGTILRRHKSFGINTLQREKRVEPPQGKPWGGEALAEQWYVLVEWRDEKQQVELLRRFQAEGLTCKAVLA